MHYTASRGFVSVSWAFSCTVLCLLNLSLMLCLLYGLVPDINLLIDLVD